MLSQITMKKIGTGPIPTKGTKQSSDKAADLKAGGRSPKVPRKWPPGTNPKPTRHGFMKNPRTTC
jgi:hypothetical protein